MSALGDELRSFVELGTQVDSDPLDPTFNFNSGKFNHTANPTTRLFALTLDITIHPPSPNSCLR